MIANSVREEVRARTDLGELVGQYVPLRRAGQSLVARCPFHEEKTPSFYVNPGRGMFYCFGCKASGDAFSFYERIEGVSFPEALRALAQRAGVEIVEEQRDPARVVEEKRAREQTERLYHACEVAAAFYEHALDHADLSEIARDELARRTVGREVASQFRLGYAPASWDALTEHLRKHQVSPADAEVAGLLLPGKRGGYYDRFRHRLMFPVWDRHGKIVAFSGRILPTTESIPEGIVPEDAGKYINSPETPIYRKSESLFGLQVAKAVMRQRAEAILVEGNFDVVAMHQHGFSETVAPLGTSFTEAQARLLRRFAESVALLFDADSAGRKAARAAHGVCARVGLVARVVVLPSGKDPDEALREEGAAEKLRERIKQAPGIVEWLIEDVASETGDNTPERIAALRGLAPAIARVNDPLEREVYVDLVAKRLHFSAQQVARAVREAEREARSDQAENPFNARPQAAPRPPRDEPFRDRPANSATGAPPLRAVRPEGASGERRVDPISVATADAIDALLRTPALLANEAVDSLLPLLDPAFAQPLVTEARKQWLSRGELDGPALLALAQSEKARAWLGERIMPTGEGDAARDERNQQALTDSTARLRALADQIKARDLKQESAKARAAGETDRADQLLRRAQLIEQRIAAGNTNTNRGA